MADWIAIETEYRAGQIPVTAIAAKQNISEAYIRKRAKQMGWVRDATKTVREGVKAHMAGAGADESASANLRTTINEATQSGIADMEKGLSNARKILSTVAVFLDAGVTKPATLKTLNDANAGAIETIRRIRQLDEPDVMPQKAVTVRYVD